MNTFVIEGGHPLKGEITPQGAKNEALQTLCAVLLTDEPVTITNVPEIQDVMRLIDILKDMGVKVTRKEKGNYEFVASHIQLEYLQSKAFKESAAKLRGSIMLLGPMLARFGQGFIPRPGGDKIGRRRLDTHFAGLFKLGVTLDQEQGGTFYKAQTKGLKGTYIHLDEISVTGTANIVMAAVLAKGTTTLYNAACEPYLQQLCTMLNNMGAKISGIGSNLLTIEGVSQLGGCVHHTLPDMIEVGSFIGLAAITQSEITIKNCGIQHLGIIPEIFERLGIILVRNGDDIIIPQQKSYEIDTFMDGSILTVYDAPWPGFTPDLISIVLVTAIQAKGCVLIHQKMFESRLFFVDKLIDMGAQIILCDPHRATVIGLDRKYPLKGIEMTSPDIRAGMALLNAALSAEGTSRIHNIEQINRGYEQIDVRLNQLGARITRV
ncbi:MAG: UDP-N-acetylglucosamine 1-carboxyvinyltransferase [Candidatus Competibacteraceae bacterium]|nr:UDP-N-acetylglucosamine 1-carboxyvinyltransferase [Candidatus Competibacteraceae bacterium]